MEQKKVFIVEGISDKKRLSSLIVEPFEIICTNGTISLYDLEELLAPYEGSELFVFVDADQSGEKIRALFKREFPSAHHLFTEEIYKEVARTPDQVLTKILKGAHIETRSEFLY